MSCYEAQATKEREFADKIVQGAQQTAVRLQEDPDIDSDQQQEQMEHARQQQTTLTAGEKDKLQLLEHLLHVVIDLVLTPVVTGCTQDSHTFVCLK